MNDQISLSGLVALLKEESKQAPQYTSFTRTVLPGESEPVHRQGNFVIALESELPFRVGVDHQPLSDFERGLSFNTPVTFDVIWLHNPTSSPLTIKVGIGKGSIRDSRLSLDDDLTAFDGAARGIAHGSAAIAGNATQSIAAENVDRLHLVVTNRSLSQVWIGGAGVAAGQGLPLASGASATLPFQCEVFAHNAAASAADLAILEVTK